MAKKKVLKKKLKGKKPVLFLAKTDFGQERDWAVGETISGLLETIKDGDTIYKASLEIIGRKETIIQLLLTKQTKGKRNGKEKR